MNKPLDWSISAFITAPSARVTFALKGVITLPFFPEKGLELRYPLLPTVESGFNLVVERVIWHAVMGGGELICVAEATSREEAAVYADGLKANGFEMSGR